MKYIPIFELPILIIMVLIRSMILSRYGIKAIVFGVTNKTDFFMFPVIFCFFYALSSAFFSLPFPAVLKKLFWEIDILNIIATAICTVSLVWFGITLKIFGKSFRVGIDESTNDKLITNGTFSISRNPVYIAFIVFFTGIFTAYPNIITAIFLVLLVMAVHRQILREEIFLKTHYGEEYTEYCKKVRRYIGFVRQPG
jgi:protein-S-isoprenylcysteine O-methyltransferase Ste14